MKQNLNPQPFMQQPALVSIEVSDEDRIEVFSESNKDAIALGAQKKELLHKFITQRQALLGDAKSIDTATTLICMQDLIQLYQNQKQQ